MGDSCAVGGRPKRAKKSGSKKKSGTKKKSSTVKRSTKKKHAKRCKKHGGAGGVSASMTMEQLGKIAKRSHVALSSGGKKRTKASLLRAIKAA